MAVDRLGAVPERDQRHERRPDHGHRRPAGGEEPRARAPDRRLARHLHHARADRHLRDARRRLAEEAWKAAIAGLLVVALFLLVFYRVLGVVAVIGLLIYAAFLYAAILLFNVTLTLPGFAGMILTLGVAADLNIVIFERVKEEYRAGKSVRAAIAAGYGKGFATIVDAGIVAAITAMVLFLVATAGVKGFALMLLIGTLISLHGRCPAAPFSACSAASSGSTTRA